MGQGAATEQDFCVLWDGHSRPGLWYGTIWPSASIRPMADVRPQVGASILDCGGFS